jgi:hypothetical protein
MKPPRSSSFLPTSKQVWAATIERILDLFWVRLALSVAIITSLIPVPWVDRLDPIFLVVFGAEFAVRLFAFLVLPRAHIEEDLRQPTGSIDPESPSRRWSTVGLLLLDFVALLSFLPVGGTMGARWLRVFRLTRMLLLVGYWAPLVRDLWSILARRERARQIILMGFVVGALSFAGAVLLHAFTDDDSVVDVTDDGVVDERDDSFLALLWWSFRQVQDPGNMLSSPMALPVVIVSLMLTVFGLFLVSFLIGMGTDVVRELLELTRLRPPGLRGHTVVVNISPSTRRLLHELMRYYRKLFPTDAPFPSMAWFSDLRRRGFAGPRYLVAGTTEEPPDFLRQPELSTIVYRQRADDEEELIRRCDLMLAKRVVLLADEGDSDPDAETIRSLVTLVQRVRNHESRGEFVNGLGRKRVIIAEILDESNLPAARAALANGGDSFRGFVVPTERLLALFFASVVRRPGLGILLEELLTSRGHEIYTCFFQTPGLGFSMEQPPDLGPDGRKAVDGLLRRGLARRGEGRVIPLGLLTDEEGDQERGFGVWINPGATSPPNGAGARPLGFVAIADNFRSIRTMAEELDGPIPALRRRDTSDEIELPELARTHRRKTTRVAVCGFRPGSIYMLEELFRSDPGGEILVLVPDQAARLAALEAIETHSELVRQGLLPGRHGAFVPTDGARVEYNEPGSGGRISVMHLVVADWMASRHLTTLPAGFGHVADLDAVIFVASDPENADKRTTTALLKLEQLVGRDRKHRPRVVAEVIDGRLAQRLDQRYQDLGVDDVHVFSIQELRAYFLFQSVVVPGFDTVYAELLGSWGQSFVHKHIETHRSGRCTFAALALALRDQGEILVAVELRHGRRRFELFVAPVGRDRGTKFDLSELVGVWVIAPDHIDESQPRVVQDPMSETAE